MVDTSLLLFYLSYPLLAASLAIPAYTLSHGGKGSKLKFFAAMIVVALILTYILKYTLGLERPESSVIVTPSFPSTHAALSFTAAFFVIDRKTLWLLALPILTSASRLLAGSHYPIDIAGGVLLAALVAFCTRIITE